MSAVFPIAISGASGQLGVLIIEALLERGVKPSDIIAISRGPDKLRRFQERGMEVRKGDFDNPGSELESAFRGAQRALIISTTPEAPYIEGKRFRQQKVGIDAAHAAGVPHIYYTSAPSPEPPTPAIWKKDHFLTEEYLKGLGVDWTILRHGEWPDWHLEQHWRPAVEAGVHFSGTGEGRIAHITREDTAAADAGALLAKDAARRVYEITGPEALTAADIFSLVAQVTGKTVEVRDVSIAELQVHLLETGMSLDFVPVFEMIAEAIKLGKYEKVTDHARLLSGRPLTPMHAYLAAAFMQES